MAIVKCPECGNMVSSTAKQCPHCGCNVALILYEQSHPHISNPARDKAEETIHNLTYYSDHDFSDRLPLARRRYYFFFTLWVIKIILFIVAAICLIAKLIPVAIVIGAIAAFLPARTEYQFWKSRYQDASKVKSLRDKWNL